MPWEICPWLFQVITSLLKSILLTQESKDHHLPFLEPISEEGKFSLFILMNLCFGARSTMDVQIVPYPAESGWQKLIKSLILLLGGELFF